MVWGNIHSHKDKNSYCTCKWSIHYRLALQRLILRKICPLSHVMTVQTHWTSSTAQCKGRRVEHKNSWASKQIAVIDTFPFVQQTYSAKENKVSFSDTYLQTQQLKRGEHTDSSPVIYETQWGTADCLFTVIGPKLHTCCYTLDSTQQKMGVFISN